TVSAESSYSVLAETAEGRDDNVVVVGAHLDSVEDGPGINDNGSGTAFVLETAIRLAEQADPNNKVRFAFWGTEEEGLVGSTEYVADLTEQQLEDIALYLNFDMIGSHNYGRFVLDGGMELPDSSGAPSGSGAIAKVFADYFASQDQVSEPGVLSGRSDYRAFMESGIPSGGLFSGADGIKSEEQVEWYGGTAGEAFDPYYHTADDTMEHIDWDSVAELSAAGAHGVEFFAESTLPVNGVLRSSAAAAPGSRRAPLGGRARGPRGDSGPRRPGRGAAHGGGRCEPPGFTPPAPRGASPCAAAPGGPLFPPGT
ncbi:M20/M25/M40 family metallo-hydrolase, partial [Nocardiopsis tropica]|nr:M20/M25/M40 family metallo-hydrolase [Nocardiopsis tropica]